MFHGAMSGHLRRVSSTKRIALLAHNGFISGASRPKLQKFACENEASGSLDWMAGYKENPVLSHPLLRAIASAHNSTVAQAG